MNLHLPYKSIIKSAIVSIAFLSSYLAVYSDEEFHFDSLEVEFNDSLHEIDSRFEMNIISSDEKEINNVESPPPSNCQNVERIPITYDGNLEKDIEKELIYPKLPKGFENKEYKAVVIIQIDENGKQIPEMCYIYRSSGLNILDNEALRVTKTLKNWKPAANVTNDTIAEFVPITIIFDYSSTDNTN